MSDQLSPVVTEFNQLVGECEVFLFITRDSNLQRGACKRLGELLPEVAAEKQLAIGRCDENYANLLLGCECAAKALIAELRMWLALKEEQPDQAWDELVSAQNASVSAARAHDWFGHHETNAHRLQALEDLLFPPQVFISSGFVVKTQECSICGKEYEDCEHLVGKPYMGRFCRVIGHEPQLDHVGIVEYPADKRCRIRQFNVEGGSRNRMTWRIEPRDNGN